ALAMIALTRFPSVSAKVLGVILTPAAMWWLAHDRLALQQQISTGRASGRSGLESLFAPVHTLSEVLGAQSSHSLPPEWGRTILTIPFALVPDAWRPDWVPPALGY